MRESEREIEREGERERERETESEIGDRERDWRDCRFIELFCFQRNFNFNSTKKTHKESVPLTPLKV